MCSVGALLPALLSGQIEAGQMGGKTESGGTEEISKDVGAKVVVGMP